MIRLFCIILFGLTLNNGYALTSNKKSVLSQDENLRIAHDTSKTELIISQKSLNSIRGIFKNENRDWFDKYGSVLVAILALIGTLLASLIVTHTSSMNLQKQIKENYNLEREKKKIEQKHLLTNELKENVAKFIRNATMLNEFLNFIIHTDCKIFPHRVFLLHGGVFLYLSVKTGESNLANTPLSHELALH